ncbi:WxL protein host-binding domain-containing protein [Weissella diestrammenae]|nr:DUF3324 domain-containing protein [Weissella diestrammenae]MCM0583207.1 DUF3324 domain-containing protein [Weissella diestrammenae]
MILIQRNVKVIIISIFVLMTTVILINLNQTIYGASKNDGDFKVLGIVQQTNMSLDDGNFMEIVRVQDHETVEFILYNVTNKTETIHIEKSKATNGLDGILTNDDDDNNIIDKNVKIPNKVKLKRDEQKKIKIKFKNLPKQIKGQYVELLTFTNKKTNTSSTYKIVIHNDKLNDDFRMKIENPELSYDKNYGLSVKLPVQNQSDFYRKDVKLTLIVRDKNERTILTKKKSIDAIVGRSNFALLYNQKLSKLKHGKYNVDVLVKIDGKTRTYHKKLVVNYRESIGLNPKNGRFNLIEIICIGIILIISVFVCIYMIFRIR